ncbi:alpha/beta hydrolase [Rheinheimera sp. MMS21-TC3]|uniref:alpha/beta fold hydrolase n=1 Tax=Rheinheimera sp. MMS21-TC3 TaxID=3072790 RepID=UPI0028C4F2D4|nr:alpha/beta hydrolase [Rheinheimera sp. MMS21-TC3]WNO59582.1 alpha/beta hydrolase [Rheinheimera sp. MMS21-TC3]
MLINTLSKLGLKRLLIILVPLFAITSVKVTADTTVPMPTRIELPQHWQRTVLKEPLYNGNISLVQAGDNTAPILFLIHGLGENGMLDWLPVIKKFESDYHIISIDLPGFGLSDKTIEQLSPSRYAELVHWVIKQFSDKPVIVAGHSMGAAISLRFAADYPQQVSKLIMLDTAGVLQRTIFVKHLAKMPESYQWMEQLGPAKGVFAGVLGKFNRFTERLTSKVLTGLDHLPDPAQLLLNLPMAQRYLYRDRTNINAALGLIYEDFSAAINQVKVPTHIIWGEQDRVTPLRTGQVLALRMPNAQLHIIKNSGHVPMADAPQQLLAVFQQALQQPAEQTTLPEFIASKQDLNCHNQTDNKYSGHYQHIRIIGCRYVQLEQVSAESIYIENAIVSMQDITINSDATALTVLNSAVTITNADLNGLIALHSDNSKIDAAGLNFYATKQAIKLSNDNALYFSVSQIKSPQQQVLHGYSLGNRVNLQ